MSQHNNIRITIAVHAKYHAFRLAEELEKNGVLHEFYTIYPKWKIPPYRIPKKKTISAYWLGACKLLWAKIGKKDDWIGEAFDRHVAKTLRPPKEGIWIFHAFSGYSEESLRAAKKKGAITFVERSCPHIDEQANIVEEEKARLLGGEKRIPKNRVWDRMKREYEIADYIVVPSNYSAKSFLERGFPPQKIVRTPLSLEKDTRGIRPEEREENKTFTVLCVGGNFFRKGIYYLLQAWKTAKLENAKLIIKGSVPKKFEEMAKIKGVEIIESHLSDEEMVNVYKRAHVLVLPSIDDGFGLVVLEAMAAGMPVIVTEHVGAKDIITEGQEGFIVPIRNPEALAEKIRFLYEHSERRREMGRLAEKTAREYTPEKYGKRMVRAYEQAVQLIM